MTDPSAPRSLNCPNCGAPISFPPGEDSIRCRFCDSSIERSPSDLTDDDDAHIIEIDSSAFSAASVANPARRFVLKMRNGQPVMIEVGGQPDQPARPAAPARPVDQSYARRVAAESDASLAASRRRSAGRAKPAASSSLGCVLVAVGIAAVVGVIAFVAFMADPKGALIVQHLLAGEFDEAVTTSQTLGSYMILTGSTLLVPGPDDGPDRAILLTDQTFSSDRADEYRLVAVDTGTRKLLWQSEPLGTELYSAPLVADADRVYMLADASLIAINLADGVTAWTATLADEVSLNICTDCFQLVDGRLAALSADGTLAVYDAATGDEQWTASTIEDSPRGLYVLGNRLAFMDRNEDIQGVLRTFDPATGQEKAVIPVCESSDGYDDYADWTTPLAPAPDGDSVYLIFGSSVACIQRWNTRALTLDWSTVVTSDFHGYLGDITPVVAGDTLYVASDHEVVEIDAAGGELQTLLHDEDNEFTLQAVHDGDLILLAQRTRGSTRYGLWVVSPTGETRWTYDLGDSQPLGTTGSIDENSPPWLVHPTAAGLRLLRFQAAEDDESHAILSEVLDWQTGESGGQTSTVLGLPTIIFSGPSWQEWRGDTLWMVIENELVAFDAANNKVLSRWP